MLLAFYTKKWKQVISMHISIGTKTETFSESESIWEYKMPKSF